MKKYICLLVVFGIGLWGLTGCKKGYTYDDAHLYTPGNGDADPVLVRTIDVDWPWGSVSVKVYDGELVQFSDNSAFPHENNLLHFYLDGDTLRIRFCESTSFRMSAPDPKDLEVLIPRSAMGNLEEISIDTESAAVFINDIQTVVLEVHTKSGGVTVDGTARQAFVETGAGDIALSGTFDEIETESRNGTLTAICTECPDSFIGESVSGDFQIILPKESGFSLEYILESGRLISDFDGQESGGIYQVGNGFGKLSFETRRGDLHLSKR
ncbi:MAG: DUF4097 domain-containing protein [Clostridiales bacterium]|jgi:hypothetical protein|nr:DUF4097 domain-containing protein [Clostridiales bacterium]